jgi:DNA-binding NarL/FixJ family response regulator
MRLIVADDHSVVRAGIRAVLEEPSGWQVVAEAEDGKQAAAKAAELRPDVAILDVMMPTMNGIEAARRIAKTSPETRVLLMTAFHSEELVNEAVAAGALGCISKSDTGSELVAAVRAAHRGEFHNCQPPVRIRNSSLGRAVLPNGNGYNTLTPRQREVLQLIAEGKSSKELAADLGIAEKTAETHRAAVMAKIDCHSIAELVRYAIRNHIIHA